MAEAGIYEDVSPKRKRGMVRCYSQNGDIYRLPFMPKAVYTVKLAGTIYVLHCFQKKSKRGSETPTPTINLIKQRLKNAIEAHERQKKSERDDQKD
jgi:phage-related protein